jgi:hypothetical protein
MYIKEEIYRGKLTQILYADEGFLLEHNETHLVYGSVSLEEGRKESDYEEIKEESPEPEME